MLALSCQHSIEVQGRRVPDAVMNRWITTQPSVCLGRQGREKSQRQAVYWYSVDVRSRTSLANARCPNLSQARSYELRVGQN
jgi:hypothetical protein